MKTMFSRFTIPAPPAQPVRRQRRGRRRWAFALVLAALSVAAGCGSESPGPPAGRTASADQEALADRAAPAKQPAEPLIEAEEAQPAPDFTRLALSGDSLRLSDYRGQVVVLNFWATWCGPCRIETPEFVALQEEMKGDGLRFIGASLDEGGPEPVRAFADEYDVNYPIVLAGRALSQQYGGIPALPTTFVIDKEGRIRKQIVGMASRERLLPLVRPLLARADAASK